jgi:hypothetical protein
MIKLTDKQIHKQAIRVYVALMRCWEMWDELAKTGTEYKSDTKSYRKYYVDCWACEIARGDCCNCIMFELWPNACIEHGPFADWEDASTDKTRKKRAKIIADFALNKAIRISTKHALHNVNWKEYKI